MGLPSYPYMRWRLPVEDDGQGHQQQESQPEVGHGLEDHAEEAQAKVDESVRRTAAMTPKGIATITAIATPVIANWR